MEHILEIKKPTLTLPTVEIPATEPAVNRRDEYIAGQFSPLIDLAGNYYLNDNVIDFKLNYGGDTFLPNCSFTINDLASNINNDELDGIETFVVFLRSNTPDFEPITLEFLATGIKKASEGKYRVTGEMFIKGMDAELIRHYTGDTFSVCMKIAEELGLGYASNVTKANDSQNWLRLSQSARDFLQEISSNAWVDDKSAIKVWIDPYYRMNYYDLGEAYKSDRSDFEKISQVNKMPRLDADREQTVYEFVFTDHKKRAGGDTYIESYSPFDNRGDIERAIGYERVFKTEDVDTNDYFEYSVKHIVLEDTISRAGDNTKNSYMGFTNKNKHRQFDHARVQNSINWQIYSGKGINFVVSPFNPATIVGMIVPIVINNNDNLNMDLKDNADGVQYNNTLSGFYIIGNISISYRGKALYTKYRAFKIRDDIRDLNS